MFLPGIFMTIKHAVSPWRMNVNYLGSRNKYRKEVVHHAVSTDSMTDGAALENQKAMTGGMYSTWEMGRSRTVYRCRWVTLWESCRKRRLGQVARMSILGGHKLQGWEAGRNDSESWRYRRALFDNSSVDMSAYAKCTAYVNRAERDGVWETIGYPAGQLSGNPWINLCNGCLEV